MTEAGHIRVGEFNQTSVSGVYAAGNMTFPMQPISAAAAQGVFAAGGGINHTLADEDFARNLTSSRRIITKNHERTTNME